MWATLMVMSAELAKRMATEFHRHTGQRPAICCSVCGRRIQAGERRQTNVYDVNLRQDPQTNRWVLERYADIEYRCQRHALPTV